VLFLQTQSTAPLDPRVLEARGDAGRERPGVEERPCGVPEQQRGEDEQDADDTERGSGDVPIGQPGRRQVGDPTFGRGQRSRRRRTDVDPGQFGVDDLDATLAALSAQGIEPEKPPYRVRDGGSRLCFVRDPDQYRIEIIERA